MMPSKLSSCRRFARRSVLFASLFLTACSQSQDERLVERTDGSPDRSVADPERQASGGRAGPAADPRERPAQRASSDGPWSDPSAPTRAKSPTADDLVLGDKERPTCFLAADADAMTDIAGLNQDDPNTLLVFSGDDGHLLWRRTFAGVMGVYCTAGDAVVLQHRDRSLSVVVPRTGTVTNTPPLSGTVIGVNIGDDCMEVQIENQVRSKAAFDGTPRPECKIQYPARTKEHFSRFFPSGEVTLGERAYSVVLEDVFDTRAELVVSTSGRRRRGSGGSWRAELPFPLDLSDPRGSNLWIEVTEGPTFVTLGASRDEVSWMATFDLKDGRLVHATDLHEFALGDGVMLEDGERLYLRTSDGLRVYDSKTGDLAWSARTSGHP